MKVALLSLNTPNIASYSDISAVHNQKYADTHNIDYIRYEDTLDNSRPPSWSKIIALQNHIDDYDWIMWIDADAIFIKNDDIHTELLKDNNHKMLLISKDCNGINCGVFFLRNTSYTHNFLKTIYNTTKYIRHPWWEQKAIQDLYNQDTSFRMHTQLIDKNIYNSYELKEATNILHLPGYSTKERIHIFNTLIKTKENKVSEDDKAIHKLK